MFNIDIGSLVKYWYLPAIAILVAVIGVCWLRLDAKDAALKLAEQKYQTALQVNIENQRTIVQLQKEALLVAQATAAEHQREKELEDATEAAKQAMEKVPGAGNPVGAYFDALGDQLRALDAAQGH